MSSEHASARSHTRTRPHTSARAHTIGSHAHAGATSAHACPQARTPTTFARTHAPVLDRTRTRTRPPTRTPTRTRVRAYTRALAHTHAHPPTRTRTLVHVGVSTHARSCTPSRLAHTCTCEYAHTHALCKLCVPHFIMFVSIFEV
jgi:hypothetical protein